MPIITAFVFASLQAERRVQERLAAFQKTRSPAPAPAAQPVREVPKQDNPEELAAQRKICQYGAY